MLQSHAPTLGSINGGAALRAAATKLQNISVVAWLAGGTTLQKERLIAFWQDQKARIEIDHGLPSDGLFLAPAVMDIRPACYKVASAIRLQGNKPADVAAWNEFCDYFINAAAALDNAKTKVASITAVPVYPAGLNYFPLGGSPAFNITLKDATVAVIPMSASNPGLGIFSFQYNTEGGALYKGKWRDHQDANGGHPITNPYLMQRGKWDDNSDQEVPGECDISLRYTADASPVEIAIKYHRGVPVAPLAFTKDLAPAASGAAGTNLGFEVQVTGGTAPYTYAWTRNGSPIGSNKNTYGPTTIAAGNHQCKVTDAKGTVINSTVCVVTVTA